MVLSSLCSDAFVCVIHWVCMQFGNLRKIWNLTSTAPGLVKSLEFNPGFRKNIKSGEMVVPYFSGLMPGHLFL